MTRPDRRNAWRQLARVGSPRRLPAWVPLNPDAKLDSDTPVRRVVGVRSRGKVYDRAGKR